MEEMTAQEENEVEDIANNLYSRLEEETEKILNRQIKLLGGNPDDKEETAKHARYFLCPDDPFALCTYEYKGIKILGVRISENRMGIEFDITDPLAMQRHEAVLEMNEKIQKGEVSNAL